jgi:hypothetical protein
MGEAGSGHENLLRLAGIVDGSKQLPRRAAFVDFVVAEAISGRERRDPLRQCGLMLDRTGREFEYRDDVMKQNEIRLVDEGDAA